MDEERGKRLDLDEILKHPVVTISISGEGDAEVSVRIDIGISVTPNNRRGKRKIIFFLILVISGVNGSANVGKAEADRAIEVGGVSTKPYVIQLTGRTLGVAGRIVDTGKITTDKTNASGDELAIAKVGEPGVEGREIGEGSARRMLEAEIPAVKVEETTGLANDDGCRITDFLAIELHELDGSGKAVKNGAEEVAWIVNDPDSAILTVARQFALRHVTVEHTADDGAESLAESTINGKAINESAMLGGSDVLVAYTVDAVIAGDDGGGVIKNGVESVVGGRRGGGCSGKVARDDGRAVCVVLDAKDVASKIINDDAEVLEAGRKQRHNTTVRRIFADTVTSTAEGDVGRRGGKGAGSEGIADMIVVEVRGVGDLERSVERREILVLELILLERNVTIPRRTEIIVNEQLIKIVVFIPARTRTLEVKIPASDFVSAGSEGLEDGSGSVVDGGERVVEGKTLAVEEETGEVVDDSLAVVVNGGGREKGGRDDRTSRQPRDSVGGDEVVVGSEAGVGLVVAVVLDVGRSSSGEADAAEDSHHVQHSLAKTTTTTTSATSTATSVGGLRPSTGAERGGGGGRRRGERKGGRGNGDINAVRRTTTGEVEDAVADGWRSDETTTRCTTTALTGLEACAHVTHVDEGAEFGAGVAEFGEDFLGLEA